MLDAWSSKKRSNLGMITSKKIQVGSNIGENLGTSYKT